MNRVVVTMVVLGGILAAVLALTATASDAVANERAVNQAGANAAITREGLLVPAGQSVAFADDVISDTERKAAFTAWIACIEAAGFPVVESELRYFGESIAIDDPEDKSAGIVQSCRAEHYQAVAVAHRATLAIPTRTAQTIDAEVEKCLATSETRDLISRVGNDQAGEAHCRKLATDAVLGRP